MKNKLFLKNAMILTGTSFLLRAIGIFFRIYMATKMGPEGMGLYQLIFSIYVLAAAAGSGLPAAVMSKLSAMPNDRGRLRPLFFAIGASAFVLSISGLIFFLSADTIAISLLSDARCGLALKILCFSLPFMGMSACIRGYFLSEHKTGIPSSAQVFEQIVRIAMFLFLLTRFANAGIEYALAAVILGDSVAEAASFLFYAVCLGVSAGKKPKSSEKWRGRRSMIGISAPVTGSRYISTLLHSAENIIIPGCLAATVMSNEIAVGQFGMLKGMAIPLLFFPASFLTALSTLLHPEISNAQSEGNKNAIRSRAAGAIGITLLASILIMAVFWLFGRELSHIIYKSDGVGWIIVVLAPIVPFMYLESVCDGILKGLTQQKHSFIYNMIDSVLRITAIFLIVPRFGMAGFLGIMIFSNIFTSSMNIRRLLKVAELKLPIFRFIILPVICAAAACVVGWLLTAVFGTGIVTLIIVIGVISLIYFGIMALYYRRSGGFKRIWEI